MNISIIAAVDENNLIGSNGKMPWHLPNDIARFKKLTLGKPVVMGRKTYDEIGKPLPERHNIVLSNNRSLVIPGAEVYCSVEDVIATVKDVPEVMIIGGSSIYNLFLPLTNKIYLTIIHATFLGDRYFPWINLSNWQKIEQQDYAPDTKHLYSYSFTTLIQKKSQALA